MWCKGTKWLYSNNHDLWYHWGFILKCQQNCSCLGALDFIEKLDNFIWPLIKVELFQTVKCVSVFVAAWFSLLYRFFNFCSLKKKNNNKSRPFLLLPLSWSLVKHSSEFSFYRKRKKRINTMANKISVISKKSVQHSRDCLYLLIDRY